MLGILERMLNQTVTIADPASEDVYGNKTFSPQNTISARVANRKARVLDANTGQEVLSTAQLVTLNPLTTSTRIWLPGTNTSDNGAAVVPKVVESNSATDGTVIYRAML